MPSKPQDVVERFGGIIPIKGLAAVETLPENGPVLLGRLDDLLAVEDTLERR